MSDNTYNGWTNYETWNVKLWIDNDQGSQEYWKEQAQSALQTAIDDDETEPREAALCQLSKQLEDEFDEMSPAGVTGVYADLMNAALGRVEWLEIAEHMLDDVELWSAGWNMPGYMPDNTPALFTSDSDARHYVADQIEAHAEEEFGDRQEGDDVDADREYGAAQSIILLVRKGSDELGVTVGQYHYFVTKV